MFTKKKKLPSVASLCCEYPLSSRLAVRKSEFDAQIKHVLTVRDRFLVVCGPCAADDAIATAEFCSRLAELQKRVGEKILLVARTYTSKPRSNGEGYLGMLLGNSGEENVYDGLISTRKMLLACLATGVPLADELLYLDSAPYFTDLISYYVVGARTSESPIHRNYASGLDVAVGVKNNTAGNLSALAQSVYCVQKPKAVISDGLEFKTSGNSFAHAILRGYSDGQNIMHKNIGAEDFDRLKNEIVRLNAAGTSSGGKPTVAEGFILADCSHANSSKVAQNQLENALFSARLGGVCGGVMLECYLGGGCCSGAAAFGVSRVDPCLSWQQTESLIMQIYELRS